MTNTEWPLVWMIMKTKSVKRPSASQSILGNMICFCFWPLMDFYGYYCKKWRPTVLIKSNLLFKLYFIWFLWMFWYFYFIQMNTNFLAKQITAIFNVQASSLSGLLKSQCQSANGAVGWWTHYKKPAKQRVSTILSNFITPRIRDS